MQLVVRHRQPGRSALTGETDDVFRTDVRREDGRANGKEADVATGQEVIRRGLVAAGGQYDQPDEHAEIHGDDDPVERIQRRHVLVVILLVVVPHCRRTLRGDVFSVTR